MKSLVLVVDDSGINQFYIKNILEEQGLRVEIAGNGEEALEKSRNLLPDLILLDIIMPGPDGFEVCQALKESQDTHGIPVIFLTSRNKKEDMIKGFAVGAVDYVNKPFNKEELVSRVLTHLELKQSQDTIEEQKAKLKLQNSKILNHSRMVENLNQELNQKNKMLEEIIKTKDKFFSIISHDLKSPLGNILSFTDLFLSGFNKFSKEKNFEIVQELKKSTLTSTKLLENLMQWARSQTGSLKRKPEKIPVYQEIIKTFELLEESAKLKNISLKTTGSQTVCALVDKDMFNTIIRNLISNAIKFTDIEGIVEVKISELSQNSDEFCMIEVIDTGVGIDDEDIEKLFKIGTNRSTPGTSGERGTGLGLILCKEFVERNKGTIQVKSKVGTGSSFIFTLPVCKE